ncbi:MAG: aromatic ring-hydroxylating dioxygenase subunit alpha [Myxococcota bacterium]
MMLDHFWYVVCASSELGKKPLGIEWMERRIVLFRDAKGQAHALDDLCPHRQVQLSRGTVRSGCLECPYHGWQFNGNGECVLVPSLAEGGKIPPKSQVTTYPVLEQQGYIWLWPGQGKPDDSPFSLPYIDDRKWSSYRFQRDLNCSVESAVENFIDCTHTGYIHAGWFRAPASHPATAQISLWDRHLEIDIQEAEKTESFFSKMLVNNNQSVKHIDSFFLPSITQVSYQFSPNRHFVGVQLCTPLAPYKTRVFVYVTWTYGWLTHILRWFVPLFAKRVLEQDVWILENQAEQLQRTQDMFVSVPVDAGNNMIMNLRRRAERGELYPPGDSPQQEPSQLEENPQTEKRQDKQVSFRL